MVKICVHLRKLSQNLNMGITTLYVTTNSEYFRPTELSKRAFNFQHYTVCLESLLHYHYPSIQTQRFPSNFQETYEVAVFRFLF